MGLPLAWLKHLPETDKEDFELLVRNSTRVLGRLRDVLHEMQNDCQSKEIAEATFDSPAWAYKQAYWLGQQAALKKVSNLLAFLDQRK